MDKKIIVPKTKAGFGERLVHWKQALPKMCKLRVRQAFVSQGLAAFFYPPAEPTRPVWDFPIQCFTIYAPGEANHGGGAGGQGPSVKSAQEGEEEEPWDRQIEEARKRAYQRFGGGEV